jgi:hypothetical protein
MQQRRYERFDRPADQVRRAVPDQDDRRDRLAGQYRAGMRGDIHRELGVRRVGQVVAEGQAHLLALAADAEHHQAAARVEAQQVRHDRQHPVGGTHLDSPAGLRLARAGRAGGWRRRGRRAGGQVICMVAVCHAASLRPAGARPRSGCGGTLWMSGPRTDPGN